MLQRIRLIGAVLSVLLLSACTPGPHQLGISQQQWQTMSDTQRQQLIDGYRQVQQTQHHATVYAGPNVVVSLSGGQVMMPPFTRAVSYRPVQFEMKPGECHQITLQAVDGNHQVGLPVCYNGLTLALDPSRYDPLLSEGSLRFNYIPIWKRGFAYNGVSSQGYVHLTKVNVIINAVVKENEAAALTMSPHPRADLQTEPLQRFSKTQPQPVPEATPTTALPAESPVVPTLEFKPESPVGPPVEPTTEKALAPVEDIENITGAHE